MTIASTEYAPATSQEWLEHQQNRAHRRSQSFGCSSTEMAASWQQHNESTQLTTLRRARTGGHQRSSTSFAAPQSSFAAPQSSEKSGHYKLSCGVSFDVESVLDSSPSLPALPPTGFSGMGLSITIPDLDGDGTFQSVPAPPPAPSKRRPLDWSAAVPPPANVQVAAPTAPALALQPVVKRKPTPRAFTFCMRDILRCRERDRTTLPYDWALGRYRCDHEAPRILQGASLTQRVFYNLWQRFAESNARSPAVQWSAPRSPQPPLLKWSPSSSENKENVNPSSSSSSGTCGSHSLSVVRASPQATSVLTERSYAKPSPPQWSSGKRRDAPPTRAPWMPLPKRNPSISSLPPGDLHGTPPESPSPKRLQAAPRQLPSRPAPPARAASAAQRPRALTATDSSAAVTAGSARATLERLHAEHRRELQQRRAERTRLDAEAALAHQRLQQQRTARFALSTEALSLEGGDCSPSSSGSDATLSPSSRKHAASCASSSESEAEEHQAPSESTADNFWWLEQLVRDGKRASTSHQPHQQFKVAFETHAGGQTFDQQEPASPVNIISRLPEPLPSTTASNSNSRSLQRRNTGSSTLSPHSPHDEKNYSEREVEESNTSNKRTRRATLVAKVRGMVNKLVSKHRRPRTESGPVTLY